MRTKHLSGDLDLYGCSGLETLTSRLEEEGDRRKTHPGTRPRSRSCNGGLGSGEETDEDTFNNYGSTEHFDGTGSLAGHCGGERESWWRVGGAQATSSCATLPPIRGSRQVPILNSDFSTPSALQSAREHISFAEIIHPPHRLLTVECWSTPLQWLCEVDGYWQELEHDVVYANLEHAKHAKWVTSVCWPCKNWDVFSFQELVKTGIHLRREHLSNVPDAIECEPLPAQVGYDDELQSSGDPDEDDEHADELP
ncbi:hypothetical protein AOLI_G00258840 [Acnodon oligacanthus]